MASPDTAPLSLEDAKDLLGLIEAGKLYELEDWIRAGKSLKVPAELKKTPLSVALRTGFHSLIEFLLRHEESQQAKNDALRHAVHLRRPDLVELTVTRRRHHLGSLRPRPSELGPEDYGVLRRERRRSHQGPTVR